MKIIKFSTKWIENQLGKFFKEGLSLHFQQKWDSESILDTPWKEKNLKKSTIQKMLRSLILLINNSQKLLTN